MKCHVEGCSRYAYCNFEGCKMALYCRDVKHKKEGMIDVCKKPQCANPDCPNKTKATYNYPDQKGCKYCAERNLA